MKRNRTYTGPSMPLSQEIDATKYRQVEETFDDKIKRLAQSMSDDDTHRLELEEIYGEMRFLPAGRVQSAMGSRRITTAYNCFVSGEIHDSMESIMHKASQAAETMRRGGGIGYDFSKLRPSGDRIKSLDSSASGPVSFMAIFDAVCQTISSSGHRRGAQMAVLRVDHPDIVDFVTAKRNSDKLTGFNVSVGITDKFMRALQNGDSFDLVFEGQVYDKLNPGEVQELWDLIMESTWDWAEPGVLFIDRINEMNNLHYCETISATNPCGEQPLPPYGACLLGSFNLVKYVCCGKFDYEQYANDIHHIVRAMDNVIDRTIYPLKEQSDEAKNKRRMGLGVTGLANAGELLGKSYGSDDFLRFTASVLECLRDECYRASIDLAHEKGPFPLFRPEYGLSNFILTLPQDIQDDIQKYGIRNSHLTSIAPTGTISLVADNISSGIEPPFSLYYDRTIQTPTGPRVERVEDYAYSQGTNGRTANELSVWEHLGVLAVAQKYVDSACSKTCNVGDDVGYAEFKQIYEEAWKAGVKGITTFRASGKRYGILNEAVEEKAEAESTVQELPEISGSETGTAEACFFDPATGQRSCE